MRVTKYYGWEMKFSTNYENAHRMTTQNWTKFDKSYFKISPSWAACKEFGTQYPSLNEDVRVQLICWNKMTSPVEYTSLSTDLRTGSRARSGLRSCHGRVLQNCEYSSGSNHSCEELSCIVGNLGETQEVLFSAYFRLWTPSISFENTVRTCRSTCDVVDDAYAYAYAYAYAH